MEREEKIKRFFNNKTNLILIAILLFALGIRIYYLVQTNGQALWWDEAEYMSHAKDMAFGVPYDENPQRPPLFQWISGLIFILGLGENAIKFLLVVLPSVLMVYGFYYLGREMYNEKIGLISAFLASVSWSFLFWGARVQPDFASMFFSIMSFGFIWKYWKNNVTRYAILAGSFAALAMYFKVSGLLVPLIVLVFIGIKDRLSALKNKDYYLYAAAFLLTFTPYFIWSYVKFGTLTAFRTGYSNAIGTTQPFGWYNINFFYLMTENILFVLFIIGLILGLKFLLYSDLILKDKKRAFNPDLLSVLALIIISAFYIFYIRGTEDRWVFLWMPFIFMFVGKALLGLSHFIKDNKKLTYSIIAIILVVAFFQISHADSLIENKKTSYLPVKFAGEWIKENSDKEDLILSISSTQNTYYSERRTFPYSHLDNSSAFGEYVDKNRPKYITLSLFEPHPPWINDWLKENEDKHKPVQAYFADAQKTQPILIIYEFKYGSTK